MIPINVKLFSINCFLNYILNSSSITFSLLFVSQRILSILLIFFFDFFFSCFSSYFLFWFFNLFCLLRFRRNFLNFLFYFFGLLFIRFILLYSFNFLQSSKSFFIDASLLSIVILRLI